MEKKTMKRWVVADWHLGEDRFAIMQRPFKTSSEMIQHLVDKHNELVAPDDLVYVVGDAVYQKAPENLVEVECFNGKKILIRGNHDRVFTDEQLLRYFDEIVEEGKGLEIDIGDIKCFMTHYPSQAVSNRFNLVGHIHSAWKFQLNSLNVGVDANHFVPHNLDEVVPFFVKAITEFYDDDVWAAYNAANHVYVGKRGKKGGYFTS
jgi:calcineurin-like phosphoesterase family protein